MAMADSGSGGGAAPEVSMTYAAQSGAEIGIAAASDELDAVGAQMPDGDYGEAGAVVATIMGVFADTAAQLVTEAKVISLGVRIATGYMSATDAQQAVDYVQVDRR